MQTWQALLGDQDVIAARFDVYDKDRSGELDASQVAEVLKDLNGGTAATEDEVKWVIDSTDGRVVRDHLKMAAAQDVARILTCLFTLSPSGLVCTQDRPASGSLTKDELKVAVAVWYTRVAEKKSSACTIL